MSKRDNCLNCPAKCVSINQSIHIGNKLIEPRQSGFRSLHSTVTALLDMIHHWCFNIDRGMVSGVIFLDLKKAFDTVGHDLLSKK